MTVKTRLLQVLELHKGEILSGETLAAELNCTRAAIWKAVNSLREEGYTITAGTNKGYQLSGENSRLSKERLQVYLKNPDVYIKVWKETVSTNQEAKQAVVAGVAGHGAVVAAETQTGGRGRRGRSFYSPADAGIYLSVVLEPKGTLQESLLLTTAAATAVYKAVKAVCKTELDIKWVNDLYYRQKKVCGILTEAITDFESGRIQAAIVGIGLNLYEESGGYPEELKKVAGGIFPDKEAAKEVDRCQLAAEMVNNLLEETDHLHLSEEYKQRNLVLGKEIVITDGDQKRKAKAVSICEDGRLQVLEEDGSISLLSYGEVLL